MHHTLRHSAKMPEETIEVWSGIQLNSTQLNRRRDLDGKRDQKGKKSKSL